MSSVLIIYSCSFHKLLFSQTLWTPGIHLIVPLVEDNLFFCVRGQCEEQHLLYHSFCQVYSWADPLPAGKGSAHPPNIRSLLLSDVRWRALSCVGGYLSSRRDKTPLKPSTVTSLYRSHEPVDQDDQQTFWSNHHVRLLTWDYIYIDI